MFSYLSNRSLVLKICAVVLLVLWHAFFLFTPAKITSGDLGRHIKNGEVVISSIFNPSQLSAFLHTNFYSSEFSSSNFINHHWGSGVVFYIIQTALGFKGLSLFYILLSVLTFLIFFYIAVLKTGWKISVPLAFFLIPLIAERVEIRPEGFSYFFAAVFLLLFLRYVHGKIRFQTLLISLPFLEMLWVNFHIYFIFGLAMVGLFGLERILTQPDKLTQIKKFSLLFILVAIASMINPSGIDGLLFPFLILQNFGFDVAENAPGWLLAKDGFGIYYYQYRIFVITLGVFVIGAIGVFLQKRTKMPVALFGLSVVCSYLAWTAVRNYTLFGLLILPTLAVLAYELKPNFSKLKPAISKSAAFVAVVIVSIATIWLSHIRIEKHYKTSLGIGVASSSLDAIKFFKENNLTGPIFNDFDIGGYLIYSLFPKERPFVDNRPEAYPDNFFQDIFIPMHVSVDVWKNQDEKFHFNSIIFSLGSRAPWNPPFIVARINDPEWAPVFADKSTIIFLKRNEINNSVISKFEIDKKRFKCKSCPYLLKDESRSISP